MEAQLRNTDILTPISQSKENSPFYVFFNLIKFEKSRVQVYQDLLDRSLAAEDEQNENPEKGSSKATA